MGSVALSIDLMLPAFPEMRREFGMSPDSTQVSWIVTAYFLGLAIGQSMLCWAPTGGRFEWALLAISSLLIVDLWTSSKAAIQVCECPAFLRA